MRFWIPNESAYKSAKTIDSPVDSFHMDSEDKIRSYKNCQRGGEVGNLKVVGVKNPCNIRDYMGLVMVRYWSRTSDPNNVRSSSNRYNCYDNRWFGK